VNGRATRFFVAAVLVVVLGAAGCNVVDDPTEHNAVIQLHNNLGTAVTVSPCEDESCHHLAGTVRNHLAPGAILPVNVSADGVPTYYSVSRSGAQSRCLRLVVNTTPTRSTVLLSSAVACSTSPSKDGVSAIGSILGWFLFIGIGLFGIGATAVITRAAFRRLRRRAVAKVPAVLLIALVTIVLLGGVWLFVAFAWLIQRATRQMRRQPHVV
jgi:hypothetical protein